MAFLSSYLRKLTFNSGSQGVQGTTNSAQGLQGVQGVQGTVGIAGTTLLTNTQSGTYTLQSTDVGEVVSGVSIIGVSSNTFNPGESIVVLNNNLQSTIIDVTGVASSVSIFQEGVGTALTVSKKIRNKSFFNILCTRVNQFIVGGTLFDADIQATGGTTIDSAGFRIHVFTSPGPFNVSYVQPTYNTVEYVVVAGGGGSQVATPLYAGGGGAGGFRTGTNFPVTVQDYTITVGGGDNNTIFSTITSAAGGAGGGGTGGNGGSGGGGGTPSSGAGTGNTPSVSPPQGNNGGSGNGPTASGEGGGGGGAGGTGSSSPGAIGGDGGIGSPITWVPASYGTPGPAPGRYFAGGGAGTGAPGGGGGGTGGSGGGGPGGPIPTRIGTPGTTNTGGGGGAGNSSGGSGIVIIRYPI